MLEPACAHKQQTIVVRLKHKSIVFLINNMDIYVYAHTQTDTGGYKLKYEQIGDTQLF